jgi:5,10-methylenetetrahydromethanopterin reductase
MARAAQSTFWMAGIAHPTIAATTAVWAEEAGWDGMVVVDSQNLSGDPYIALAMAARETERLGLGTGVTNPTTRHPAVTATSIASVQVESGGRAFLGIGRGDSALAHLGLAPASVPVFEDYLRRLQAYLRGDEIEFEAPVTGTAGVEELHLAGSPTTSRLHWLRPGDPKVPVEVAATGPKVIGAAARHADRVLLAVGADPVRLRWGMDTARAAREAAGLDPAGIAFGAFVNVVAHPDVDVARKLASGSMSTFARFSVMHGRVSGPASEEDSRVLAAVRGAYDMTLHTRISSPQAGALTPDFIDRFGVVGPPERCVERLREVVDAGIERVIAVGPAGPFMTGDAAVAASTMAEEVLPALRA